jgi:hypothetical protein
VIVKVIIDFGSRSTKVYVSDGKVTDLVFTHNKDLISQEPSFEEIDDILETMVKSLPPVKNTAMIQAIATEAARRSATLEYKLAGAC